MFNKWLLGGFAIIGVNLAITAHAAEDSGLYLGAGIGEATIESGEFDESDTAFKVFGGYAFNRYFSAELAYVDAGTQEGRIGDIQVANESNGIIASALASLPIGEVFSLYAKLGYAFYDSETTFRLGDLQETESESDEDLTYGIGVEFAVWRGLKLRA
jgi:opacity protein-like surface antigen